MRFPLVFIRLTAVATGVSWANGVGRSGSILGSMSGGVLLTMDLHLSTHLSTVFLIVGLPALIGGVSMFVFGRYREAKIGRLVAA